jgi:hypothetical protein
MSNPSRLQWLRAIRRAVSPVCPEGVHSMSGLSNDPAKRTNQLANLKQGGTVAPAGNQRARRHGAYAAIAEAELEEKTRHLFDALAFDAPVRAVDGGLPSHDTMVVRMLAEVLVRRERVRVTELRHGLETPDGRIRGVVEYGLRLDAQAFDLAKELGMTPAARAKLDLDLVRSASAQDRFNEHVAANYGSDAIDGEEAGS